MLNLDTHVVVFALAGALTPRESKLLKTHAWSCSAIVLWELAKLRQFGRIEIDLDGPEFARLLARVHIYPLDLAVCRRSTNLDFSSDPADELIAATSIVHSVPLLTRDRKLLASKIVPLA